MAAPKKPKDQFRGKYVVARMTDREHRQITTAARKARMSVAEYIRKATESYIQLREGVKA